MRSTTKRSIILIIALTLCLSFMSVAQAEEIFGSYFEKAGNISPSDNTGVSTTVLDNTVYRLLENGDIYAWDSTQNVYSKYAHVPATPFRNVEIPFSQQSGSLRTELMESVSQLIPADDNIYGFNSMSGMFGLIDKDGWYVGDIRLDTSALRRSEEGYSENFCNSFIADGKLYAFNDINLNYDKEPKTTLLIFDLSSGVCDVTSMANVISFCRYTSGKLLCLQDDGTKTPVLMIYDIASQTQTDIDVAVPVSIPRETFARSFYLHHKIGGMAYDAARDTIYLESPRKLWRSVAGSPFEAVMANGKDVFASIDLMNPDEMNGHDEAWVLASGGYVSQYIFPLGYVKP